MKDSSHVDDYLDDITANHENLADNVRTRERERAENVPCLLKRSGVGEAVSTSQDYISLDPEHHQERILWSTCQNMKRLCCKYRGFFYILIACVFFAATGVFVQLASSVHALLSSCFRGVCLVIFPPIGLIFAQKKPKFSRTDILWITVNSSLHTITQVCGFMAYSYIPVGDVNAIIFSTPLFSGILAWIFLKERLTFFDISLTIASVVGVFLVSKPAFIFGVADDDSSSDRLLGSLYAIGALGSASCVYIVTRKLRPFPANALVLALTFGMVACPTSAVLNTYIGEWALPADLVQTVYLSAVGVSGFLAILFFSLALETEKAVHVSVTNALSVILTYIMQFIIFRVYPDVISGMGAILICGSMCGVFISKRMTSNSNSSVGEHYHAIIQGGRDPNRELQPEQNTQTAM